MQSGIINQCSRCHRRFEGIVFKWIVPKKYPNVATYMCSECFVKCHEEGGRDISISLESVSKYLEVTDV